MGIEKGDIWLKKIAEMQGAKILSTSPNLPNDPLVLKKYKQLIQDPGKFAAMKGYDGIEVVVDKGVRQIVILNRSKLIVLE